MAAGEYNTQELQVELLMWKLVMGQMLHWNDYPGVLNT